MNFKIRYLDHIALRVSNIRQSVDWYVKVLGLKAYTNEVWGDIPVFLMAGNSGLALFPKADGKDNKPDHFAFNISITELDKLREHLEELDIKYEFQDHHIFHSVYFRDPDSHVVEVTAAVDEHFDFDY